MSVLVCTSTAAHFNSCVTLEDASKLVDPKVEDVRDAIAALCVKHGMKDLHKRILVAKLHRHLDLPKDRVMVWNEEKDANVARPRLILNWGDVIPSVFKLDETGAWAPTEFVLDMHDKKCDYYRETLEILKAAPDFLADVAELLKGLGLQQVCGFSLISPEELKVKGDVVPVERTDIEESAYVVRVSKVKDLDMNLILFTAWEVPNRKDGEEDGEQDGAFQRGCSYVEACVNVGIAHVKGHVHVNA